MSSYDGLLGVIYNAGEEVELRGGLNFIGVTITQNESLNALNVTFIGEQGAQGEQGPPGADGADGVMAAPADPADDNKLAVALAGDLAYYAGLTWTPGVPSYLNVTGIYYGLLTGVGESNERGMFLVNTTAATLVSQIQRSPAIELQGNVWNTGGGATAGAQMALQMWPTPGNPPTWQLVLTDDEAGENDVIRLGASGVVLSNGVELRNVTKPTGVAVSAAAIHAALVTLGLIEA